MKNKSDFISKEIIELGKKLMGSHVPIMSREEWKAKSESIKIIIINVDISYYKELNINAFNECPMCFNEHTFLSQCAEFCELDINKLYYCEECNGKFKLLKVHNKNLIDIEIL